MSGSVHEPVAPREVARLLLENSGKTYLDVTCGGGGHIAALLQAADRPIKILGLDLDPSAVQRCRERFSGVESVKIEAGDYGRLEASLGSLGAERFDGVLADFGQSSDQLEDAARGMSHRWEGPLDMRYNPAVGVTAEELLNHSDYAGLVRIFGDFGGERKAPHIARAVIRNRPITTTSQLADLIARSSGGQFLTKTLSRCFMGLRVAVNDELGAIERFLPAAFDILAPNGRLVCLTFDSSQDLRVKNFFRSLIGSCDCPPQLPVCLCGAKPQLKILTHRALKPSAEEISANPRSRSALLRAAEKF